MTTDPSFCKETEAWLNSLVAKSTLVSGVSEKERKKFYMRNKRKVEDVTELIYSL